MVTIETAKPAVQIGNEVRQYLREYGDEFHKDPNFSGFSEALQERESELIDELVAFWLDVQKEARNPENA